jgi:hypothetical protein
MSRSTKRVFPRAASIDGVKRAGIEIERRALARAHDDHGLRFHDAHFEPRQPKPVMVSELSEELVALEPEESQAYKPRTSA